MRGRASARRALLVVIRGEGVDAGWLRPKPATAWATVSVPIAAAADRSATPADLQAALRALQALLTNAAQGARPAGRGPIVALVDAPWLTAVALPWADAFLDPSTARPHVRAELAALGFGTAPDDRVCIDPRPPLGMPRTVMSSPAWLHDALRELAAALQAKPVIVQSLSAAAAVWSVRQTRLPPGGAAPPLIGVMSNSVLRLMQPDGGAPQAGHELAAPDDLGSAEARAVHLWRRARLRHPALDGAARLPLLLLDAPPSAGRDAASRSDDAIAFIAWPGAGRDAGELHRALLDVALRRPTLDAAAPPARRFTAAMAAAALCLAAAGALGWHAWQRQAMLDSAALPAGAPAAERPSAPMGNAEMAEVRAVNAAIARINLPLPEVLRTLRAPRDIVVLLQGLDVGEASATGPAIDGGAGERRAAGYANTVKLSAEAASGSDMTRYVSFLGDRKGISAVQLVRHDIDAAHPAFPYRFVVEFLWRQ